MNLRNYRHRVTIQQRSAAQDEYGQPVTAWTELVTVWASVEDLTGREYQAAQSTQNPVQTRIRIRYRNGILPSMRVVHGATIYNIEAVLDRDGSRTELQLMSTKGLNDG